MMDGFLTLQEAALRVRLSPRTLRRALSSADRPLRHFRVGRRVIIPEAELLNWLKHPSPKPSAKHPSRDVAAVLSRLNRTPGALRGAI